MIKCKECKSKIIVIPDRMKGSVLIPIKLATKVCIKRKYGKHPAKYIYPFKTINQEVKYEELVPRVKMMLPSFMEGGKR